MLSGRMSIGDRIVILWKIQETFAPIFFEILDLKNPKFCSGVQQLKSVLYYREKRDTHFDDSEMRHSKQDYPIKLFENKIKGQDF